MPWTNASIVLSSRDRTGGTYNAAKFNAINQNVIQGQVHSISVNEINFPYDIPNVQAGFNRFYLLAYNLPGSGVKAVVEGHLEIVITPGFYTGTELATAINLAIVAEVEAGALDPTDPDDAPTFSYDEKDNRFTMEKPVNETGAGNPTPIWALFGDYTFPSPGVVPNTLGKDLLSIMGYNSTQASGARTGYNIVNADATGNMPFQTFSGGSAPLAFTQYIDICSPLLCQYQYFRDGSTTNLARRSDVICRLYVSNNVATQEEEGGRPFVIHRQFNNARVMRWSAESSVGQMDINLFDDVGQPLTTTYDPRPYQITFNCYEQDKDSTTY
jgi:hypothetical protein